VRGGGDVRNLGKPVAQHGQSGVLAVP